MPAWTPTRFRDEPIYWGKSGTGKVPAYKRYKHALRNADGVVPQTLWSHEFAGHTDGARKELRELLHDVPSVIDFQTPKPSSLIQRILQVASAPDSLILDSFAGSGTTAHAVLKQNAEDGGHRRCILVEMDPSIARDITAERVRRVAQGYTNAKGEAVPGLGGGFRYAKLGHELFTAAGHINPEVKFADLARFVWFMETGTPLPTKRPASPLLGVHDGRAIYLLYNGILKDKSVGGGNVLTSPLLAELPPHDGPKTIYGTRCPITPERRRALRIDFKQLPYQIKVAR